MSQATINVVANLLGQTVPVSILRTNDGGVLVTPTLAAGAAGTLTTRTDNTNGVATLGAGHGIQANDKVDVFWDGGSRFNMTATVNGNAVTLASGGTAVGKPGNDNLPAQATALVVCKKVIVNVTFDPDDMAALLATATRRAGITFVDSGGAVLMALDMAAGGVCLWWSNSGITRPMTGNAVTAIWVSSGDASAPNDLAVGVVYDATP